MRFPRINKRFHKRVWKGKAEEIFWRETSAELEHWITISIKGTMRHYKKDDGYEKTHKFTPLDLWDRLIK